METMQAAPGPREGVVKRVLVLGLLLIVAGGWRETVMAWSA